MDDRLFDPGPPLKPPKKSRPLPSRLAHNDRGAIYSIAIGTVTEYIRAYDEDEARLAWREQRHRRTVRDIPDEDIRVRRLTHADLVKLEEIDPKLVGKMRKL